MASTAPARDQPPISIATARRRALSIKTRNNSIGRITTTGTVTNRVGTGINQPIGIANGPDGALWFTNWEQLDRPDHHDRNRHEPHRNRHQRTVWHHGRARWRALVHQLREQLDRPDHDDRNRHELHRNRHQHTARNRRRARRRTLVHQLLALFDRAHHRALTAGPRYLFRHLGDRTGQFRFSRSSPNPLR